MKIKFEAFVTKMSNELKESVFLGTQEFELVPDEVANVIIGGSNVANTSCNCDAGGATNTSCNCSSGGTNSSCNCGGIA